MDLLHQAQIIDGIRETFANKIGERCFIKVNLGRSRVAKNKATIKYSFPKVFVADVEYNRGRHAEQSFLYADILTGIVEVYQNEKKMFGPFDIEPDAPLVENAIKPKPKKRLRPATSFEHRIKLTPEQVVSLAERVKAKTLLENDTTKESLINDLSKKYDLMKKSEKKRRRRKKSANFLDDSMVDKFIGGQDGEKLVGSSSLDELNSNIISDFNEEINKSINQEVKKPKKRGRKKGSKNKSTILKEQELARKQQEELNKKNNESKGVDSENSSKTNEETTLAKPKRKRGRPRKYPIKE